MKTKHLLVSLLLGSIPVSSAHALAVSSETKPFLGVNYSENVLNTLLAAWQKPQIDVSGVTAVTIRLAKDGRPYSCEIKHNSSSPDVDNSICQAISQIGHFQPLQANDTGEVYLTFVHDNKPFLQEKKEEHLLNSQNEISGNEQVDTVQNSVDNPIRELQKSSHIDVESSTIIEENVSAKPVLSPDTQHRQLTQNSAAIQNNAANSSLPLATAPQPNTIKISRAEALQEPSKDLVDPAQFTHAYSQEILRQASPKIRIPSNFSGKYQVVVRIDVLGSGKLKNAQIIKSSQQKVIDNEILRVLTQEVQYAPLPQKLEESMWLTFNITK
jgi:TonB family protein